MERIIISQLDIDISLIEKKQAEILQSTIELRESQKELRKSTNNLKDATEEQAQEYVKQDAALKDLNGQYQRNKAVLAETTTGVKSLSDALTKEVKTEREAADNTRKLIKIRKELDVTTKEGAKARDEINAKIDANNKFVEKNSSLLEKQKINIGNYASALDGVVPGLGKFISGLEGTRVSMLAIPIFAIIAALSLLFKAFTSTQEGIDRMNKILNPLKATFEVLVGFIGKYVVKAFDALKFAFENPKQALIDLGNLIKENLINRVKAFGVIGEALSKLLSGDFKGAAKTAADGFIQLTSGVENATDKIAAFTSEVGEMISTTLDAAAVLENLKQKNIDLNRSSKEYVSQLEIERGMYEQIRDDATKSFAERENAAAKLQETEAKIAKERRILTERQLQEVAAANAIITKAGNTLTNEQKDQYSEALIAFNEAKAAEVAIALNTEREIDQLFQDRRERDLDILKDGAENQAAINLQRVANEKITFAERQAILNETLKLSDDSFAKQIEVIQSFTDKRVDANELLKTSDAVVLNERIRALGLSEIIEGRLLEVIRDRRTAEMDLAAASSELQIQILQAQLEKEAALQQEFEDKRKYAQIIKFQEELILLEEQGASQYAIRLAQLDNEYNLELADLNRRIKAGEASERERNIIEKKYSDARKLINREEHAAKLQGASQVAGQIASILGKQSLIGKAAAITQATINTYEGATKALATLPPPFGAVAAAITTAQGLLAVGKIAGVSLPKFATGTERVTGQGTETSDSVHAMLSVNERVVDAKKNRRIGFNVSNDELVNGYIFYRDFLKGTQMSDRGIISALNENTKAVKQKPVPKIMINADAKTDINANMYLR